MMIQFLIGASIVLLIKKVFEQGHKIDILKTEVLNLQPDVWPSPSWDGLVKTVIHVNKRESVGLILTDAGEALLWQIPDYVPEGQLREEFNSYGS